jgi:hypothetical protein
VLSTVDPDGVIARFRMGEVATDLEQIKRHLQRFDERREFWETAGSQGCRYVRAHHDVHNACEALAEIIKRAAAGARGRA